MSSSLMDAFWAAPPVTRTMTAAVVVVTWSSWLGLLNASNFVFFRPLIFKLWTPQLWRPVTAFLLTGPQLGMLLDPYFLFTYGKSLETGSARFTNPAEFMVCVLFMCSMIVALSGFLLNGFVFLQPLILAFTYLHAQENPEQLMTFYVVTFRVKFLPYCMLLMTMIMASPEAAINQAMGLVAAHMYDFLTRVWPAFGGGFNPIRTPEALKSLFALPSGNGTTRSHGTAFQARPSAGQAQGSARPNTGGWTSGFTSNNVWGSRGAGQRLGGD